MRGKKREGAEFPRQVALLLPLSGLFRVAVRLRRWLYQRGLWRAERVPVPVVVVGNLAVGGTGKTPMVVLIDTDARDGPFELRVRTVAEMVAASVPLKACNVS